MAEKSITKINALIFKELIKRGYSEEEGKKIWDIADSKLWYLKPDQAQSFLDYLDSEETNQNFAPKEKTLIDKNIDDLVSDVKEDHINIVDLGCGDARKAIRFIEKLKGKTKVRYCPIDISDYMVTKAIKTIQKTDVEEVVKFQWNISDFENIENVSNLLRYKEFKKNFFLLLGNTLSNFEINDLLYRLRSAMKGGDYLIIGNGLDNDNVEGDVIKFCKNSPELNKFFRKVALQLGIETEKLEYDVRFRNSRIEFYFKLTDDKEIEFQEKKVEFKKGDEVIVGTSYYYTKKDFMSFLRLYFDHVDLKMSEDGSYALAICKK